jgi:uncharacterized protein
MPGRAMQLAAMSALLAAAAAHAADDGPSFDCSQKLTSSVEQRICNDPELAALDRQLADAYNAAWTKTTAADTQTLTLAQRAWSRSRNDCWKTQDVVACVANAYRMRTSELVARYRLQEPVASARYACPGPPPQEATADFFATDPPTAMVTYAGVTQFMRRTPSGSGVRYTGGARHLWEQPGAALILWGASTRELTCPRQGS